MKQSSKRFMAFVMSTVLLVTCLFSVSMASLTASAADLADINNDGQVNMMDSALLYAHTSGSRTLSDEQLAVCDINNDGVVNMMDSALLFRVASGQGSLPTTTTTTTTTTATEPTTTTTAPAPVEPAFDGLDFLKEEYIAEGAENITINEDGTWTVSGNFALAPNVTFDYTVYPYIVQKFTNTAEMSITLLDRDPNGAYTDHWINLYNNWAGPDYFPAEAHDRCDSLKGIYDWCINNYGWADQGNQATVRAIYVSFNGSGSATFEALGMVKAVPTTTTTSTTTTTTQTTTTTTTTIQTMGELVTFSVGSATGSIGDTIVIPVSVSENHYMVNGQIFVHYDPDVLEIQPVWDDEDNPYFEDYNNKIFTNKYMWAFNGDDAGVAKFAFAASAAKGTTVGGEMYALTFKIVGEAPEGSAITVEIPEMCSCDGVTNGTDDYNTNFTTVNGLVTVI